jgi:hypothetical protein
LFIWHSGYDWSYLAKWKAANQYRRWLTSCAQPNVHAKDLVATRADDDLPEVAYQIAHLGELIVGEYFAATIGIGKIPASGPRVFIR